MATGTAVHIGLNSLDPSAYDGWDGALAACENDATAMQELTSRLGYGTQVFLTSEATTEAVFGAIADAASALSAGDIFVITYAGHGGQFDDLDSEEEDSKDETWLLYNREILDDELHSALSAFAAGVRVVVLSDSCHSGTVTRAIYRATVDLPAVRGAYDEVAPKLGTRAKPGTPRDFRLRGAPADIQKRVLRTNLALYTGIRAATPRPKRGDLDASVILISGCQDNQESAEQNGHGAFTAALLDAWAGGTFTDDYPALHRATVAALPPTQSPNYFLDGATWPAFEAQIPFTIEEPSSTGQPSGGGTTEEPVEEPIEEPTGGTGSQPWVEGPAGLVSRSDPAPSFTIHTGGPEYYIFEIAADPDLFDGARVDDRTDQSWYSSWDDPEAPVRLTGELYWLPDGAWESLRGCDQLWFRIGTTPAEDSWDGYAVSTNDDDGANAPSITIMSSAERQLLRAAASAKG